MKKKLSYFGMASLLLAATATTSCESGFNEFDNFDYSTVYFATQFAERTLELGEDEFVDNSLDNQRKVSIKAAWGGGYNNPQDVTIDFVVDESLCDNLYFVDEGTQVFPMPSSYYQLASDQIRIPAGQIMGGVEVQLTEAFFADPNTVKNYYAIPLRMTDVAGADSILMGSTTVANPTITNVNDWSVQPKNYVVYVVKYVNEWHGEYLRRGVDRTTIDGVSGQTVRHAQYIEDDEVVYLSTQSLTDGILGLTVKDGSGNNVSYNIGLAFAEDGTCSMTSLTDGVTVTRGEGKFVKDGEKNSLGGKDRDAIYLDYEVDFADHNMRYAVKDTLVLRTRGVVGGTSFNAEVR